MLIICLSEELDVRNAPLVVGSTSLLTCKTIQYILHDVVCTVIVVLYQYQAYSTKIFGLLTQMLLDCRPSATTVVPQQGRSAASRNHRPPVPLILGKEVHLIWVATSQERKLYLSSI